MGHWGMVKVAAVSYWHPSLQLAPALAVICPAQPSVWLLRLTALACATASTLELARRVTARTAQVTTRRGRTQLRRQLGPAQSRVAELVARLHACSDLVRDEPSSAGCTLSVQMGVGLQSVRAVFDSK